VKRGEAPCVIEVADGFENIHNPMRSHKKSEQWESKIVDCKEIRADIVKEWSGAIYDCPPGAGMGILEIAGEYPTEDELRLMMEMQTRFAEWCFQRGEECIRDKKGADIRGMWRTMAMWLGRKTTNNWATPSLAAHDVNCYWCQTLISPNAKVCVNCTRTQPQFAEEVDEFDANEEAPAKRRPGRPRKEVMA